MLKVKKNFCGQSVYYAIHPLFLTGRAIYLFVNDLSRDLNGKVSPKVKRRLYEDIENVSLYLVPSVLKFPPLEDERKLIAFAGIPPLYLKFRSSRVLSGLFPRVVFTVFQWCTKELSSQTQPQLHQNLARFYTDPAEGCSIILRCYSSFIKVVVHKERCAAGLSSDAALGLNLPSESICDESQVDFARAVCRRLKLVLKCTRNEFPWWKYMAYDLLVCCPVCCANSSVNHCCNHNVRGCKEEQCPHLLSESQLLASRGSIAYTRSVVAVNCKIHVDFVGFWFGSLEEQVIY